MDKEKTPCSVRGVLFLGILDVITLLTTTSLKVAGELNSFATAELYENNGNSVLGSNGQPKALQLSADKSKTEPHGYSGGKS